jgi:hypothetical protein
MEARMAVLVDFEKVRESRQMVEYAFGFPEMGRRMVIETATQRGTPLDGLENLLYEKAYLKIVRIWLADGTWPERGGYAA